MRKIFCALCVIFLLTAALPALAETNLITNGDFSDYTNDLPANWIREVWYTDEGVSTLTVDPDGYEGSCISVCNFSENDARFAQTVTVKPDTLYRVSAMCRAEGIGTEGMGATLSVKDTFVYSNVLNDTDGEWMPLELYGRTGADQNQLTLYARVGGYGMLSTGSAWFDNIELTEIDEAPQGVNVSMLSTPTPTAKLEAGGTGTAQAPIRHTEAFTLLSCIFMLLVLATVTKFRRAPQHPDRYYAVALAFAGLAALAIRAVLAMSIRGYYNDINCFLSWSERMFSDGPLKFYNTGAWCDYPPGYMLMLWPIAALRRLLGIAYGTAGHLLVLKLWPILFDLASAALIWRYAKPTLGARSAMLLSAFYLLNPAVFVDSAAWGQIDSVFTLVIVLSALMIMNNRTLPALLSFAFAVLIKPQSLLFAPMGLIALGTLIFQSEDRIDALKKLGKSVLITLGSVYLFALLFCFNPALGLKNLLEPVRWLCSLYGGTMTSYANVTVNALNLYNLFGLNWAKTSAEPVFTTFAWFMFALSYVLCALLYHYSRRTSVLPLLSGLLIVLIFTFGPMIHERYVFPAVLLLLIAYIYNRDKRLLISLTVLSATLFLNQALLLQGALVSGDYGHLQNSERWLNAAVSMLNVLNALFLTWTCVDICLFKYVYPLADVQPDTRSAAEKTLFSPSDHRLHLKRPDVLLMVGVTLLYSIIAFTNLGTTEAPQTVWTSQAAQDQVVFDLGSTQRFRLTYYGGICNSNFTVELSNDGSRWTEPVYAEYKQGTIFRWLWFTPKNADDTTILGQTMVTDDGSAYVAYSGHEGETYPFQTARYVRLSSQAAGLVLHEVGFLNENGEALPVHSVTTGAEALVDEQQTVAPYPSYYNSTYFDEIYHARTAYEHLHGMNTYEWTHPPLGKVLMMVGIELFGMTPFGWRFMGALMGVLMLPLMYLLAKQLTKSTLLSFIAMFLMSVDSMHFTQTRIATIDSYGVFWIMLMTLFMFRFFQMRWASTRDFRRSMVVLALCGTTMGVAWATKWIGIYASAGLAILFFWSMFRRWREYVWAKKAPSGLTDEQRRRCTEATEAFWKRVLITLGVCVAFFIVVPVIIYYFSYYWHLQSHGVHSLWDMFAVEPIKTVAELQKSILNYHNGLSGDTHSFRSPWFEWPLIVEPIWFYSGTAFVSSDMISSISCMGNPAVWWFGFGAMVFIVLHACITRRASESHTMVIISAASQYLPWILVTRSMFIYHYFATVPFIILASVLFLQWLRQRSEAVFRSFVILLCVSALLLFIAFYPLESGLPVLRTYANHLRWFNWRNF
ncbi:MAG: phospholipid carrier-dependent glycosyltransferase [Christensenellales bacterium]|nr:phospholipid carrier-dependent glycosyltransferase [Christensenellales bacterium]